MAEEKNNSGNTANTSSEGRRLPPAALRAKNRAEAKSQEAEKVEESKQAESLKMPVVEETVKVEDPIPAEEEPASSVVVDPVAPEVEETSTSTEGEIQPEVNSNEKKERQKVKVTYKDGKIEKIQPVKKPLTKEEKKQKKILKKGKRHYWWRYLLVFFAGIIFPFVAIGGALAYGSMVMTTSQLVTLFGGKPEEIFAEAYQDKTVMDIIKDIINGEITFDNLGGIRKITPLVDNVIYNVNIELDKAIGFTFDMEELYTVGWNDIGNYIFEELQSGIKLAKVLGVNENSTPVLIYLAYNTTAEGETDWNSPRSLGDLMNNMDSIINNAKIGDLIDVGTSGILYNLRDVKVGEMAQAMETRPLNQIIDIADDAFPALKYIGNYPVGQLSNALDNATLEDLLPIEEDSVLWELRDKKITEVSDEIMNLKLGDVIKIDETSGGVMNYLKDTPLNQITDKVKTLPIDVAIEITEDSPIFLKTLRDKNANLSNIGEIINSLTLADIVNIGDSRILAALANSSIDSLAQDVQNLTLGDVYDCDDPNAPMILKALKDVKVGNLGNAIHELKISEIIEIKEDSPMILKALANTKFEELESRINTLAIGDIFTPTEIENNIFLNAMGANTYIETMGDRINELTFVEVFADQIYEDPNADVKVVKSTWKYLLKDSTGNINTGYKISTDMPALIENMERNIKNATLDELKVDGFLDVDQSFLDKNIGGYRIGDLTMKGFIEVVGSIL